jgi:leukotriene-A4 hydrolase
MPFQQPTPAQLAREASTDEKSTQSNWRDAQATHASIEWRVDFDKEVLRGAVTYDVTNKSNASTFIVDTHSGLTIHKAYVDNVEAEVLLGKPHAIFGISAAVPLPPAKKTCQVRFEYSTAPECSAAQWLNPAQTAGKKRPYLFTQSQAIHARALLPCQDAPGAKMSWDAVVDAPQWATALMSGLQAESLPFIHKKCPSVKDTYKRWFWKQPVPTSSYLIAIVVADLEARDISERCRVWSEPSVVDKALHEFSETEQFLRAAEDITGQDYVWKRYDLVCLAPSFPYGGMENPCLTFVTPTLLAGDRSLAGVVAHEIAHSWTGNLVTNATWEHFWLNEGWTRWLERKIKARTSGKGRLLEDFDLATSQRNLTGAVKHFTEIGQGALTALVPPIEGVDPDDAFSLVPYEKGSSLIHLLERTVGEAKFSTFVKAYIREFRFTTVTTAQFRAFVRRELGAVSTIDWCQWFHAPGDLPQALALNESLGEKAVALARQWLKNGCGDFTTLEGWTTDEKVAFLDALGAGGDDGRTQSAVSLQVLDAIDDAYSLTMDANAEIRSRWCKLLLSAGAPRGVALAVDFVTCQGRMKFVRPLYRALRDSPCAGAKETAISTFVENADFYHPICRKMVASDLGVELGASGFDLRLLMIGGALVAIGLLLARRR